MLDKIWRNAFRTAKLLPSYCFVVGKIAEIICKICCFFTPNLSFFYLQKCQVSEKQRNKNTNSSNRIQTLFLHSSNGFSSTVSTQLRGILALDGGDA